MIFTILLALSGLILSAVAIYYSVLGLTAIFAAAFWPIVVMGTTLEVSKLVAASWLKAKWSQIPFLMKTYMMISVLVLMLITSMGIFGFLSKAHSDQSLVSGDVQARVALIDEKIKVERENISNSQQLIKQMDAAVNGVIATGDQEIKLKNGKTQIRSAAERSLQIRRSQAKDRAALTKQIEEAQARILKLQEEAAPIRAEIRKVEAEVGPIKYIAKFIYGDNADTNLLEKAVTWVIITIIFVFDPLAILLLLSSQMTYQWWRSERDSKKNIKINYEEKTNAVADDIHDNAHNNDQRNEPGFVQPRTTVDSSNESVNEVVEQLELKQEDPIEQWNEMIEAAEQAVAEEQDVDIDSLEISTTEKIAMKKWKAEVPGANIHRQRNLLEKGLIKELPWLKYIEEDLKAKADDLESEPKKKLT